MLHVLRIKKESHKLSKVEDRVLEFIRENRIARTREIADLVFGLGMIEERVDKALQICGHLEKLGLIEREDGLPIKWRALDAGE